MSKLCQNVTSLREFSRPLVDSQESDARTVGSCDSFYARAAVGLYTDRSRVARAAWRTYGASHETEIWNACPIASLIELPTQEPHL